MVKKIGIIDSGNSNVLSVLRAVEKHTDIQCLICKLPEQLTNVDKIIIPGVGSFPDGLRRLQQTGLDEALKEFALTGGPVLGICLGMQLLASVGYEFNRCDGLGIIEGSVEKLNTQSVDGHKLVIPFVGWAEIQVHSSKHSILTNDFNGKSFYFVHSYQFNTKKIVETIATYKYGGYKIPAVIADQNLLGVQFHPEKSGEVGLRLLENFIKCDVG